MADPASSEGVSLLPVDALPSPQAGGLYLGQVDETPVDAALWMLRVKRGGDPKLRADWEWARFDAGGAVDANDFVYLAPAPVGNDANPGTAAAPVATIGRALELIAALSRGGRYLIAAAGTYPPETGALWDVNDPAPSAHARPITLVGALGPTGQTGTVNNDPSGFGFQLDTTLVVLADALLGTWVQIVTSPDASLVGKQLWVAANDGAGLISFASSISDFNPVPATTTFAILAPASVFEVSAERLRLNGASFQVVAAEIRNAAGATGQLVLDGPGTLYLAGATVRATAAQDTSTPVLQAVLGARIRGGAADDKKIPGYAGLDWQFGAAFVREGGYGQIARAVGASALTNDRGLVWGGFAGAMRDCFLEYNQCAFIDGSTAVDDHSFGVVAECSFRGTYAFATNATNHSALAIGSVQADDFTGDAFAATQKSQLVAIDAFGTGALGSGYGLRADDDSQLLVNPGVSIAGSLGDMAVGNRKPVTYVELIAAGTIDDGPQSGTTVLGGGTGTAVVSAWVTAGATVQWTHRDFAGVPGLPSAPVAGRTTGTPSTGGQVTLQSANVLDTSTVDWTIDNGTADGSHAVAIP